MQISNADAMLHTLWPIDAIESEASTTFDAHHPRVASLPETSDTSKFNLSASLLGDTVLSRLVKNENMEGVLALTLSSTTMFSGLQNSKCKCHCFLISRACQIRSRTLQTKARNMDTMSKNQHFHEACVAVDAMAALCPNVKPTMGHLALWLWRINFCIVAYFREQFALQQLALRHHVFCPEL